MQQAIYTNVTQYGKFLYLRGIDKDGFRVKEKIPYSPSLYVNSRGKTQSKFKTVKGKFVDKINFDTITEAREFMKQYEDVAGFDIYGLTRWVYTFINEQYPGELHYDRSKLHIGEIDIEVSSEDGFADIETVENDIQLITIKFQGIYYTLGTGDYENSDPNVEYIKCRDEEQLLVKFISLWQKFDLDIVTGWNIEGYDIPYIVNRIAKVLGDDFALKLSPWGRFEQHKISFFGKETEVMFPVGIAVIDYLDLFKKFGYTTLENYKLDTVAEHVLKTKKLDYSKYKNLHEFYVNDYQNFVAYNIHDVRLIGMLDDELGLLDLVLTMAYDSKVNYVDTFTTVLLWDVIVHNYMLSHNIVVDNPKQQIINDKYEGAYVKEPIPGLYSWMVAFDVASEYPSLIMTNNISPETYRGRLKTKYTVDQLLNGELSFEDKQFLIYNNYSMTANGALWDKSKQGVLPALVSKIFAERQFYRDKMKEEKQTLKKIEEEIKRRGLKTAKD